jgi:hypothetical protein
VAWVVLVVCAAAVTVLGDEIVEERLVARFPGLDCFMGSVEKLTGPTLRDLA